MNTAKTDDNRRHSPVTKLMPILAVLGLLGAAACTEQTQEEAASLTPVEELETRIAELEAELAKTEAAAEQLRQEKARLEEEVPRRHQVEEGETHWQISFDFLTGGGMAPEEAERTLADAFLLDPIVEGQETWSFYDGETFGSFVTQDEAPVSPGATLRTKEATMANLREHVASLHQEFAIKETELETQINEMRYELNAKDTEAASLRNHIAALRQYQESLASRLQNVEQRVSSVYYLTGSRDQLREEGKIHGTFLDVGGPRLGDLQSEDFQQRLDLRESSEIELRAEAYQLPRIEDVTVLPRRWTEGRDYEVQIAGDGGSATLRFLNPEEFRMKTLVLVVDS